VFSPSVFSPSVFSPEVFLKSYSNAQARTLVGVSAREGTASEDITASTWNNTGYYYVRVQGRNGVSSSDPFEITAAVTGSTCGQVQEYADEPTLPGGSGRSTVILTDSARVPGTAQQKAQLAQKLDALASRVDGVVVDVDASAKVRRLNEQADAHASCPYAKNLVAQAIRDIVNSYRDSSGSLKDVVLVGDDAVIPFFRYADRSGLGPEEDYVPPLAHDSASEASLRRNQVLGQDAYGAEFDVSTKGSTVPVPDLPVGRLVETPAEIGATIDNFLGLGGGALPAPTSSLVTGYDFLTDAADAVAAELSSGIGGNRNDTLITDQGVPPSTRTPSGGQPSRATSWTADDLRTSLLGSRHDVVFLAGHFSANNALAADDESTLGAAEIAAAPPGLFRNALVYSAGCHSGYSIVDDEGIPQVTDPLDWSQAFAQQGAILVAGTGYQYGDTDFLEYSERLYLGFTRQLRTGSGPVAVGEALAAAKREYLAETPELRGIHEKALLEATLYGLPMLGVDLPGQRLTPEDDSSIAAPAPVTSGPGSDAGGLGLQVAQVTLEPQLSTVDRPLQSTEGPDVTASYLTGPDGIVTNPAEPALPLVDENVSVPGRALRGVGLRSGSYTDTDGVTPLTGAPATEYSSVHGPFVSAAFFPNRLARVNYFDAISEGSATGQTRLMLTPTQYRSDAPGSTTTTQRRYSAVGLQLFYSSDTATYGQNVPSLSSPPSLSGARAEIAEDGRSVTFSARVVGDPSAGVQQAWVTYTGTRGSPWHGTWSSLDLQQDPEDSTRWSGRLALPAGQSAADVRYLAQAVSGVGLVGVADNSGTYYTPGVDPTAATVPTAVTLRLPGSTGGVYASTLPVQATLDAPQRAGQPVTFTIGGASRTAVTDATGVARADLPLLATPGVHDVTAAFEGSSTLSPAASDPLPVTVSKLGTSLVVTQDPAAEDSGVSATLTARDLPVRSKPVYLVVTDAAGRVVSLVARATNSAGTVRLGGPTLPAGRLTVRAFFGSADVPLPGGGATGTEDPVLAASTASATLDVLGSPAIVTTALPGAARTVAYSAAVRTTGHPAPTLRAAGLPRGLALSGSPDGGYVISGTPVDAGTYRVLFTATSAAGTATVTLPLVVDGTYVVGRFAAPFNDPGQSVLSADPRAWVLVRTQVLGDDGWPIPDAAAQALVRGCRVRIAAQPAAGPSVPDAANCLLYQPEVDTFFYFAWQGPLGYSRGDYDLTVSVYAPDGAVLGRHAAPVRYE
ncbi:Ig-like domain repeat protein, partial [Motilibacter aurantiacus]|uniref:Ig-like domain repeat protein n=1 Tax=Motilibacter aurantiacus TaxID=2714955 RepID=UPI0018C89BEF